MQSQTLAVYQRPSKVRNRARVLTVMLGAARLVVLGKHGLPSIHVEGRSRLLLLKTEAAVADKRHSP